MCDGGFDYFDGFYAELISHLSTRDEDKWYDSDADYACSAPDTVEEMERYTAAFEAAINAIIDKYKEKAID
ncbi:MAG TPA: hypothetical protein PKW98_16975 [Candidatus Wallbacteria bacterium]|nr:MAG: hypothetical protein BWY32_03295 [bacterium ADurb.Bin243]HOD42402.1 hypothetical protein [Candidatus Wallbacteria bacterium]HPG59517.1 hypothetical protein [Candidatus Wallbacteria bacterium]